MGINAINSVGTQQLVTSISGFQQSPSAKSSTADVQNTATVTALVGGAVLSVGDVLITPSSGSGETESGNTGSQGQGFIYMMTRLSGEALNADQDQQEIAMDKAAQKEWINSIDERLRNCTSAQAQIDLIDSLKAKYGNIDMGASISDVLTGLSVVGDQLKLLDGIRVASLSKLHEAENASGWDKFTNFFTQDLTNKVTNATLNYNMSANLESALVSKVRNEGSSSSKAEKLDNQSKNIMDAYESNIEKSMSGLNSLIGGF